MTEQVRKQSVIVKSAVRRNVRYLLLMASLFAITAICFWLSGREFYTPPEFEKNAFTGIPKVDEHFMYGTVATEYGFQFSMATNVYQQEDQSAYVYFTNYEANAVNMMCEIRNAQTGQTCYKSGVITPGQYIEKLFPVTEFPNEAFDAQIMIYTFEEGSWHSGGTVEISAIVQAW